MGTLLTWFFVSIFFSFLCSILEAVLLSVNNTFLNVKLKEGASYASKLKELKDDVDKPLIAILTLNTIAHTAGAIGVGASAEAAFINQPYINLFGLQLPVLTLVSVFMTLAILIASEIIPKTIGATYWKSLAGFSTKTLNVMVLIMKYTGMMWLLQLFTRMIGKGKKKNVLSRADYQVMTEMGAKQGIFEGHESRVIQNILKVKDLTAENIMTPRTVLVTAPAEMTIADFNDLEENRNVSRVPLFEDGDKDKISQYVLRDDALDSEVNEKGHLPLSSISRPMIIVDKKLVITDILDKLKDSNEHIVLAMDQFGGVAGVVSLEDVVETLLGMEIMDETDKTADLQAEARKNWQERANELGIVTDTPPDQKDIEEERNPYDQDAS